MTEALIPMLKNVIVFIALAVPGFLLVKFKQLKQEHSGVLSKFLMYVGMPFFILSGTMGINFSSELIVNILIVAGVGVLSTIGIYYLSILYTLKWKGDNSQTEEQVKAEKTRGMMRFCTIFANNGFLGLPLCAAVFGNTSPIFAYLVILVIIMNTLMYTFGATLVSKDKRAMSIKSAIINPALIGFIVGIIFNVVGLPKALPEVSSYATYFSNLVTPISMTILGMKMGGIKFTAMFKSIKMYYVSAIKLVLIPLICVPIMFALHFAFGVSADLIIAVFISTAMPTAGLASTFADRYDGDTENAVIFTLGTTVLSVITIPLLFWLVTALI